MRLSSTAAVSVVLGLAWAAGAQALMPAAQPGQPPAPPPPAPAAQPGAAELANAPADNPDARKLLNESVAAITKMGPVRFTAKYISTGVMQINGTADIIFVRNHTVPQESLFWAKGRLQMPALPNPDFHVSRYTDDKSARRVAWQDDAAKVVFDRPEGPGPDGKETEGMRQMGLALRAGMILPPLVPSVAPFTPFMDELKESRAGADVNRAPCVFLPDEEIAGEPCKVINVVIKQNSAERRIWISTKDKLPRKYEQFRNGLSRHWEIHDLKPLEGGPEVAKLKTPDGYRFDKSDEGGIKPPVSQPPGPGMPANANPGGPQPGQLAPDFDLKTPEGASVSLASLKGQTVIVNFGGSMFPQSWATQSAAAKGLEAKAKIVSIACRETDPAKAAKAFTEANGPGQLLLGGDQTAGLYNVRGFPGTCVIGPDGKVKAFFEGPVTNPAELAAAVEGTPAPSAAK